MSSCRRHLVTAILLTVTATACTSGGDWADNLGDAFKNCGMGDGTTVGADVKILISPESSILIAHSIEEGTCVLEQVDAPEDFVRTIRQGTVADSPLRVQWRGGWSAEYLYPQGSDRGTLEIVQGSG